MSTIFCWRCGLEIDGNEAVCEHCGAPNPHAGSGTDSYTTSPLRKSPAPSAPAPGGKGGCLEGTGCGCGMGFLSLMMGIGLAGIPVVGWILAVGFIGAAFLWPVIGGWLGSQSPKE